MTYAQGTEPRTKTNIEIPPPLQQEHQHLHAQLRAATQVDGEVGQAAEALAGLMHPHFVKEEEFALPPLGLLQRLAAGELTSEMAEVLPLTDRLADELPAMLAEHKVIVDALERLAAIAKRAGRNDIVDFANQLTLHAQTEEQVMYPASLLVGALLRERLRRTASAAVR